MSKFQFSSLTHKGPVFPAEYEPRGVSVAGEVLSPLAEEMLFCYARYYSGMSDPDKTDAQRKTLSDYVGNKYFNKNFYACLKPELTKNQQNLNFPAAFKEVCDFFYSEQKRAKALETKEKKAAKKEASAKLKAEYGFAIVDGKSMPRGSYVIEAPSIIITRGESKLIGSWKYRVKPEDVVINWVDPTGTIPVPQPPAGHKWGKVENNLNSVNTFYYDVRVGKDAKGNPITVNEKWCRIGGEVTQSCDKIKYDKAVQLIQDMPQIDAAIQTTLTKPMTKVTKTDIKERDCALVLYIVRQTSIRIGGEHEEFEAQTVGASTLLAKNMSISGNQMTLDFAGKDSVPYKNTVAIDQNVANLLAKIIASKTPNEQLFMCSATDVNAYLQAIVPYASVKLFRTALASAIAAKELQSAVITDDMSVAKKLQIFENVNLAVAKKLNHQKNISASFKDQTAKLKENKAKAKESLAATEEKVKAGLAKIQKEIKAAKAIWKGADLKAKLSQLDEKKKKLKEKLDRANLRVEAADIKIQQKTATANYALGTSKSAYFGPEIIFSWCKTFDVPVNKIYSKTLQDKYSWAVDVDRDYWKNYPVL